MPGVARGRGLDRLIRLKVLVSYRYRVIIMIGACMTIIIPSTDLRNRFSEVESLARQTREPIYLT